MPFVQLVEPSQLHQSCNRDLMPLSIPACLHHLQTAVKGGGTAGACRSFVRAEGKHETATGLPASRLAWAPELGLHATATRHAKGTKLRSFSLPALLLLLPGGLIALALLAPQLH